MYSDGGAAGFAVVGQYGFEIKGTKKTHHLAHPIYRRCLRRLPMIHPALSLALKPFYAIKKYKIFF
jgi:hypothetical protein